YDRLAAPAPPGLYREEWAARTEELRRLVDLVEGLGVAAGSKPPPRVEVEGHRYTVVSADAEGVTLERGGQATKRPWASLAAQDLLHVLTPSRPGAEQRLGVAVLAGDLGRRKEVVAALLPLFEKGVASPEANRLAARYLYGRTAAPPGGYRAYGEEILDEAGYARRLQAERIARFLKDAEKALARIQKESSFKKLAKLRTLRTQLDERRKYALLAIFDEKHYPYPTNKSSRQYQAVQKEVDRRVALVGEIWDDPRKVTIHRRGTLGRALDAWDAALAALKKEGRDTGDLEARLAGFLPYATGEPVGIREIFLDGAERKRLAYDRWVMGVYNPAQIAVATESERKQTRVTNDYRVMLGFQVAVKPGPAAYDAIDGDTVVKILDEGKVVRMIPLLALRIDDRLLRAARGHSLDMQKRGYFAHQAPPDPATGEPGSSPFQRMKKAGYQGMGASENIVAGASNAKQAHEMWIHSSGHHRNILSAWVDQGVGRAGRLWTQNYGTGGGAPPKIEPPRPASGGAEPDKAGDQGPAPR
ncbi:MAG: CAP domain-containing protein, partial [Planctomycetota bacterium]